MKKVLINRHGAFGDMIHMSHLPRLLKDNGWDYVGVSTGYKGKQVLANNPFVDKIHYLEFSHKSISMEYHNQRLRSIAQNYDHTIDLLHSLEHGALAMETRNDYYQHQKVRDKIGKRNYYDISTTIAGYPHLCGKYKGEMFFTDKEIQIVEHDLLRPGRFKDNFKVMVNISGSSPHKYFIQAEEVCRYIIDKYPESVIFLTGDRMVKPLDFSDGNRIRSIICKKKFRQAALMCKYMDLTIGCESGMMCVSSMHGTPTIQLMTAADINNHCKYAENDYSLQSPCRCSPCYKGPHKYYGCPRQDGYPKCIFFDVETIKRQVDKVYEETFSSTRTS